MTATAEDLLTLKGLSGAGVRTWQADMTTTFSAAGKTSTAHSRIKVDHGLGAMSLQNLDDQGHVRSEIRVLGTEVYFHSLGGSWIPLTVDAQTRGTLAGLGVPMDAPGSGLGGTEGPGSDEGMGSTIPTAAMAQARRDRVARQIAFIEGRFKLDRRPEMDDAQRHLRVLRRRPVGANPMVPFDEELESIDETTGLSMEGSRWVSPDRWPGGRAKMPPNAIHRTSPEGNDLVELEHHQVMRTQVVGGQTFPAEVRAEHFTATGEVDRETRWQNCRINQVISASQFEVSR